jgi:hypothetical protein
LFNIRWGIISGIAAFFLSLVVGSLNHVAFGYLLIRALIFAVLFFALGAGVRILISSHLSELLTSRPPDEDLTDTLSVESPGSRINITLGEAGGAVPEMYRHTDSSDEVGNIADLVNGTFKAAEAGPPGKEAANGMDHTPQDGYTNAGVTGPDSAFPAGAGNSVDSDGAAIPAAPREEFQPAPAYSGPVFTASVTMSGGDLGGLPDLDAMAGAFLSGDSEESAGEPGVVEMSSPARSSGGKKPEGFEGDFNPKELAEGIRTILVKEKQG